MAVIEAARQQRTLKGNRLVLGGKSMGGRIASQVAATGAGDIAALVFLGYPLHPPGNPEKLRDEHLPDVKAPMLFIQGSRDAFGTPEEISSVVQKRKLRGATIHIIEGGDHSFAVPKSAGVPQDQLYEKIMDFIASWLQEQI